MSTVFDSAIITATILIMTAIGCSERAVPSGPTDTSSTIALKPTGSSLMFGPRNMDRDYFEIAATVPGFGGIYDLLPGNWSI